jgi:hypothetical protein
LCGWLTLAAPTGRGLDEARPGPPRVPVAAVTHNPTHRAVGHQ